MMFMKRGTQAGVGATLAEPDVDVEWQDHPEEEARLRAIREFLARGERRRRRRRLIAIGVVGGLSLVVGMTLAARSIRPQPPSPVATAHRSTASPVPDNREAVDRREPSVPNREAPAPHEPAASNREALTRLEPSPPDREALTHPEPVRDRDVPARREPPPPETRVPAKPLAPAPPRPAAVASKPAPPQGASTATAAPVRAERPAARAPELPPRTVAPVQSPALSAPALTSTSQPLLASVSYHPQGRLASIHAGDTKDKVFGLLATSFERQNGSLVRVEGIRLRSSARSPRHAHVEIAEARIAEAAAATPYWFLFGDERLLAWGRPEEWAATAGRYQVESTYTPDASRGSLDRRIR
jgi:hypothetical protein